VTHLLRLFRLSGHLEAYSYLALLLIAMPLKYYFGKPVFVRWTGTFHGFFFILFVVVVAVTAYKKKWSLKVTALAFFSAFIPLGPFLFERKFLPAADSGSESSESAPQNDSSSPPDQAGAG
jgi:integral membrane protein